MNKALDDLRGVLLREDDEAELIWKLLTGLRGPDEGRDEDKEATTCVIRWHFLGKPSYESFRGGLAILNADSPERCERRVKMDYGHFRTHAKWAFEALGLKWDEVNE